MTDDISELEQENRLVRARNARLEAEVTVLTEMVRVLSAKIAELEALAQPEQEPVATDDFFKAIADKNPNPFPPPQRTWVGLTPENYNWIFEQARTGEHAVQLAEAILKEGNT